MFAFFLFFPGVKAFNQDLMMLMRILSSHNNDYIFVICLYISYAHKVKTIHRYVTLHIFHL